MVEGLIPGRGTFEVDEAFMNETGYRYKCVEAMLEDGI